MAWRLHLFYFGVGVSNSKRLELCHDKKNICRNTNLPSHDKWLYIVFLRTKDQTYNLLLNNIYISVFEESRCMLYIYVESNSFWSGTVKCCTKLDASRQVYWYLVFRGMWNSTGSSFLLPPYGFFGQTRLRSSQG